MAVIQANRESIDDRFSVLGFTVRTENPLFEIGLATDPELLKAENRQRRTASNFFSSKVLGASQSRRGEAVYLVPPSVVARFIGQPKLYFGLATYSESDRSRPVSVNIPDRGNMYVSLSGLTERGLRRTARADGASAYGAGGNGHGNGLAWGGDASASSTTPTNGHGNGATTRHAGGNGSGNGTGVGNGNGNGNGTATTSSTGPSSQPVPYSDGYSDDLWQQRGAPIAPSPGNGYDDGNATTARASSGNGAMANAGAPATAQAYRGTNSGYAQAQQQSQRAPSRGRQTLARPLLVSSYYQPTDLVDALRTQIGFFVSSAMWYLGVSDTTVSPHTAICQVRRPDGSAEGALHGSAFFIAPRLLLTAAHVVDGQSELIIVPGKNGGSVSTATEPFGRFRVSTFRKHGSYTPGSSDFDMALICVPAANAVHAGNYFDLVEELTQSRPEGVVVCGYAARWYADDRIEHFVNATIDPNKQHLHGGYIRSLPTDETFDYDLQTLGGTSGSPVYWIEDGAQPRAHMVGVHVAAHSETTNLGCRITPAKRQWIAQQAAGLGIAFALGGSRSLADAGSSVGADVDPDEFGITEAIPDEVVDGETANTSTSTAQGQYQSARARAQDAPAADYPNASRFAPAHARNFTVARNPRTVDRVVIHITAGGSRLNGTVGWFQNPNQRNSRDEPIRVSAHYIVGRDGEVVQMVRNADIAHHASRANTRSIGIEHNANKKTGLSLTPPQYEASARLVAWLCAQYNLPIDRQNIVGHHEISPHDNHDCPSSIWDWDYFIACVRNATNATPTTAPTAQGLGHRAYARAQEIITPFYDPADAASALTCQADAFSLAREEWFAGVPNTTIFPHAAICLLEMHDGSGGLARGTGFYIGRNRILTCGHNLHGQASVDIIPGNNGQGNEPFGRCTVNSNSWRIPASYGGSNPAYDLAVIDNVPIAAPGDRWFDVLEELNQSRPEGVVVCGYSSRSTKVPELTAAIDGFKQHLHAGYIAALGAGDSTFDYPILTLKRASGSPVYYISDKDGANKAYIVGVHTGSASDDLNRGCRLTNAKIDWIEGRTTSLALGSQSTGAARRTMSRAQEIITPFYDPSSPASALICQDNAFSLAREEWFVGVDDTRSFPHSAICQLLMTDSAGNGYGGTGFYIGNNRILTCAHNLHGMVNVTVVPGQNGAGGKPFGQTTLPSSAWRVAPRYSGSGNWENDLAVIDNVPIAAPNGQWFQFLNATPSEHLPIVVCGYSGASPAVPELTAAIDGDKQHLHGGYAASQSNGEVIEYPILTLQGASGSPVYHLDRSSGQLQALICAVHVTGQPAAQGLNRGCFITPTKIDWIEGRATSFALGARTHSTRALGDGATPDYPVGLIPQPNKDACWAAAMAMLLSWRRGASTSPETLVNEVGGSLASSYNWDLLEAVRLRYGFEMIAQPSDIGIYHSPQQWSEWLNRFGPLWVVIVGAPHAVVIAGIRGNLADPASVQVKVLNPWDTRVAFDSDPITFRPANNGYEDWLSFNQFAADFGNMAEPDYGNWRVLHLPATAAAAQALSRHQDRSAVTPRVRAFDASADFTSGTGGTGGTGEPVEPSRVPGTRMSLVRGSAGANRWSLDQLEGQKSPAGAGSPGSQSDTSDVVVELGAWPASEGDAAPLPLTLSFRTGVQGSVGDVQIRAGTPAESGHGVEVVARIEDDNDVGNVAAVRVAIDYRFNGFAQGAPAARIELRLLGDGRYERVNRWLTTTQAA